MQGAIYKKREVNTPSPRTPRFVVELLGASLPISAGTSMPAPCRPASSPECSLPRAACRRWSLRSLCVRLIRRPGIYRELSSRRFMKILERSTSTGVYSCLGTHWALSSHWSQWHPWNSRPTLLIGDYNPLPPASHARTETQPISRSSYSRPFFHIDQAVWAMSRATFRRAFLKLNPPAIHRSYRR